MLSLIQLWEQMGRACRLNIVSDNWLGVAHVESVLDDRSTLIYYEKGYWQNSAIYFSNTLRWRLDRRSETISLEHLRRGKEQPVFLQRFVYRNQSALMPLNSHFCGMDVYKGRIDFSEQGFCLRWRVSGPEKKQQIDYTYFY